MKARLQQLMVNLNATATTTTTTTKSCFCIPCQKSEQKICCQKNLSKNDEREAKAKNNVKINSKFTFFTKLKCLEYCCCIFWVRLKSFFSRRENVAKKCLNFSLSFFGVWQIMMMHCFKTEKKLSQLTKQALIRDARLVWFWFLFISI